MLARRRLSLRVAVEPEDLGAVGAVVRACADAGVSLGLWPLLTERDGRWASDGNVEAFRAHLEDVLAVVGHGGGGAEVVFDLEPPFSTTRAVLSLRPGAAALARAGNSRSRDALAPLVRRARERGLSASAVVAPFVLGDPHGEVGPWQRLLGTPVDGAGFGRVAVMAYTSLFEGYGRGLVRREDARSLLVAISAAARSRWGDRAGVALGVVGGGVLGDERPYRAVEELIEDVALARATGVEDLSLYSLDGVLDRPRPESWLDAFVGTEPARHRPPPTLRARGILGAGSLAGRLLGRDRGGRP